MASDWMKVRLSLATCAKVRVIAHDMGVPVAHALGCMVTFYSWAHEQTTDGFLAGITEADIDEIAGGARGFAKALQNRAVRWLRVVEDGVWVERWVKHNGEGAKARAENSQRMSRTRVRTHECAPSCTKVAPEKRREELRPPLAPRGAGGVPTFPESAPRAGPEDGPRGGARRRSRAGGGDAIAGTIGPAPETPTGFAAWWAKYPPRRKAARAQCLAKWAAAGLEARAPEILAGLDRWIASDDWDREMGRYVCAPIVWLNQARWEAHPLPAQGRRAADPARDEAEKAGKALLARLPREARYAAVERFRTQVLRGMQVTYSIEDSPKFLAWLSQHAPQAGDAQSGPRPAESEQS